MRSNGTQDVNEKPKMPRPKKVVTMPFGKYKGTPVKQLPHVDIGYFVWLTENVDLTGRVLSEVTLLLNTPSVKQLIVEHKEEQDFHAELLGDYYSIS
jgi:uncharacterized protein (DUF3820 family)